MSIIERSFPYLAPAMSSAWYAGHDDGLEHCHHWAKDCATTGGSHPVVADARSIPTPSCVLHDDAYVLA